MHDAPDAPTRAGLIGRVGALLPAFAAGIAALIGSRPLNDNSFLTHLATGRLILEDGFPHHDPYTFTAGGEPWIVQSWFASLLYAVSEELGGLDGVRVLNGVLAGLLGLVAWRLTARAASPLGRLLSWTPIAVVGSGYWVERPLLLGLLFLGLTLLAAEDGLDRRWLVPVGWLWVNTHGSWPLALVALGTIALGQRLDRSPTGATLGAGRWLLGGIALGAVNPYGPRLLLFPLDLLSRQEQLRTIVEWQAPAFESVAERGFLLLVVAAIVGLCRAPRWQTALPLVVFTVAALLGARNLPVASLVLLPGLAASLHGIGSVASTAPGQRSGRAAAAFAVTVAILGAVAAGGGGGGALALDRYPVAATVWLEDHGLDPRSHRVIAPELAGNFWALRYGDDANVFIDDRMEVIPEAVVGDFLALVRGRAEWSAVLDDYGADAVLWPEGAPLVQLLALDPGWALVHTSDSYVVYARA